MKNKHKEVRLEVELQVESDALLIKAEIVRFDNDGFAPEFQKD